MATNSLNARFVPKADTSVSWSVLNPILLEGELGLDLTTNRFKRGDGTSRWSALPYITSGNEGSPFPAPGIIATNLTPISVTTAEFFELMQTNTGFAIAVANEDVVKLSDLPNATGLLVITKTASIKNAILYDVNGSQYVYNGTTSTWSSLTNSILPDGGTTGQALTKLSATNDDVDWVTPNDPTKAPISHANAATTYGVASASLYGHAKAGATAPPVATVAGVAGTDNGLFARADHAHVAQTTITGNAGTATKLAATKNINGVAFDGSADITIQATPTAHTNASGATYGQASATLFGHARASAATPLVAGTAAVGTDNGLFAREGHIHPAQTTITGNAGTASKLAAPVTINGTSFDGSAAITITAQPIAHAAATTAYGVGSAANYGHVKATALTGAAPGVASAGTDDGLYARGDHVHPSQTTISGNAGTATTLATPRNIGLTGTGITATAASFNGSANIDIAVTALNATAITAGVLPVARGGIGVGTLTGLVKGNGTSAFSAAVAGTDYVVPSGSITGNSATATALQNARTIALSGAVTGTATSFNGTSNITIPTTSLDATKLTGLIPITSIPATALERVVVVADDTARFALTTAQVQIGDVVRVTSTGKMFFVVDDTKLNVEAGYLEFTAGTAASVPWSGVTGRPTTLAGYGIIDAAPKLHTDAAGSTYGQASASLFGHAKASSAAPIVAGTANVGTDNGLYAREGHIHPAQTTITGNAGTATALATAQNINITGTGITATAASFNGTAAANITITALNTSALTAGTLGVARGGTGVTTITGLVKGNGTSAFTAATAGTDYVIPSGSITGNAGTATALQTSRSIQTDLGSESAVNFNGTANISPGIKGVLSIPHGGTGGATADEAKANLGFVGTPNFYDVVCATAVSTAAKAITIPGYTLKVGDCFAITYTAGNTAASHTININGAGAKSVRLGGGAPTAASGTGGAYVAANGTLMYRYDGTYFHQFGSSDITDADTSTVSNIYGTAASQHLVSNPTVDDTTTAYYPFIGKTDAGFIEKITATTSVTTGGTRTFTPQKIALRENIFFASASTTAWTAGSVFTTALLSRINIGATNFKYAIGEFYDASGELRENSVMMAEFAQKPLYIGGIRDGEFFVPKEFSMSLRNTSYVYKRIGFTTTATAATSPYVVLSDYQPFFIYISGTWVREVANSTMYGYAMASSALPLVAGTAAIGIDNGKFAREGHVHPAQTTITGNAGTATALAAAQSINITGTGITATAASFNGTAAANIAITALNTSALTAGILGVARGGTGVATITGLLKGNGVSPFTAAVAGTDYVIPSGSITGNAATATVLQTARTIGISGAVTGTATSFNGSANITIPVTALDVSAATAGLLPVARGGTGVGTLTGIVKGNGTGAFTVATAGTDYVVPSGSITGNAATATILQNSRTIALSGAITGTATSFNGSANIVIPTTSINATYLTGLVPLTSIPQAALANFLIVADTAARLTLTSTQVQNGDVVKVTATGLLYFVVDDTKLNTEEGWQEFTAGIASSVPWSGITSKPTTLAGFGITDAAPKSHASSTTDYGISTTTNYGHVRLGATAASASGTASAGTANGIVANANHVHPLQTTVTGNAGTATTLQTSRTIGISGTGVTSTATSFNGSANITIPITVSATGIGAEVARLQFTNTSVTTASWTSDSTYTGFTVRKSVALSGVTAAMTPMVVFAPTEATSGNFAPVAVAYAGGVYIYAKAAPTATFTIPTIIVWS